MIGAVRLSNEVEERKYAASEIKRYIDTSRAIGIYVSSGHLSEMPLDLLKGVFDDAEQIPKELRSFGFDNYLHNLKQFLDCRGL